MKPKVSEGSHSPRSRGFRGLLAGGAALLVVTYPLAWLLSLSHAAFSGCWIGCGGDARPVAGFLYATFAGIALGVPLAVGLLLAGSRSILSWCLAAAVVAMVIAAWVVFSRDPENADFFVSLARDPLVLR